MSTKILLCCILLSFMCVGCAYTYKVNYPPASEAFVTCGDDPGTESNKSYIPKGFYFYTEQEVCLPIPVVGLIGMNSVTPDKVYKNSLIPAINEMGGDALICGGVDYTRGTGFLGRFFGVGCLLGGGSTIKASGNVVKRP
ncbi:MAG: hypothetical protein HZA08_07925 [Nitrospirae bacterium]|nr:hypothetical protein [Nitrospirota bacterium]